jgi:hypothetical protein
MAYRQSGYGPARSVAKKSDKNITSLQEIRAKQIQIPTQAAGGGGWSTREASAAGMPGYYSSQRGPAVTKRVYRNLAAIGSGPNGFDNPHAFFRAQGIAVADNAGADELQRADQQAMIKWADRNQLQGFGVKLERDDVEFLEQKRAEELQVRFDEWLARRVNLDDPANQRWFQEIYPEFYERRERFIDDKINLEAALAKIKLRGVKDKSELQLLYAINAGLLQPSSGPLFAAAGLQAGVDYKEGMASVLQWFTPNPNTPSGQGNAQTLAARNQATFTQPHLVVGNTGATL